MGIFDWLIVFGLLVFLAAMAIYSSRFNRSIADFLAANRCAGRYLLGTAAQIAGLGAISFVALFEVYYEAGFTALWWGMVGIPFGLMCYMSGFLVYRYRQTRAMTMAQFFEMRYSKKFRIFAGVLGFFSGALTYGIFPIIGAKLFVYYCELPMELQIGNFAVPTYTITMVALMLISLFFTFIGGQIAVIVTDFCQGAFGFIVLIVILGFLLLKVDWSIMNSGLSQVPDGKSMIHPLKTGELENYNFWYFAIGAFAMIYNHMSFQGSQAYNCSAKDAHEARMAKIWMHYPLLIVTAIWIMVPMCAYMVLHNPAYAALADKVSSLVSNLPAQEQKQMSICLALKQLLPVGMVGAFAAFMLAAFISTHDSQLHSWGSIFAQDIIMPFRKKPFGPKQHMWLLRSSIVLVAVFACTYSLLFKQTQDLVMYWALTAAVYVGGVGAVIIGGLYWKKGSTLGAWITMIWGGLFGLGSLILKQIPEIEITDLTGLNLFICKILVFLQNKTGQVLMFYTMASSIILYIIFSLFSRTECDMDKLLHRGKYGRVEDDASKGEKTSGIMKSLGITDEFTPSDKLVYLSVGIWQMTTWFGFIIFTIYNSIYKVGDESWSKFWCFYIWLFFLVGAVTTIWFMFAGCRDLRKMFARLSKITRNTLDDGTVTENHSLPDEEQQDYQEIATISKDDY